MTNNDLLTRVDYIISKGAIALTTKSFVDYSGWHVNHDQWAGFRTSGLSFITSLFGHEHIYSKEFLSVVESSYVSNIEAGVSILQSIKHEIEQGWLTSIRHLITADIFADFIEMSEHLLKEGYKDAAAVIAGCVLEDSLKKLAETNNIPVTNNQGKMLTIEPINVELAKKEVYNKLVQKQVTAWADLRNNAAHGNFGEYNVDQVKNMLAFVTQFTATYLT